MEAAIGRVAIFARAIGAHREFFHRGVGAIVRQGLDDREARPAIRAVGEGITKATIGRIENFAQAIVAGRDVRQNEGALSAFLAAFPDLEFLETARVEVRCFATLDDGAGRPLRAQASHEIGKTPGCALDLNENTLGGIDHPALEIQFRCQSVNKGSKPDALDRTAYRDFHSPPGGGGIGVSPRQEAVDEADLVNEEQPKTKTENTRRGPEMPMQKLKPRRIGNRNGNCGRDQHHAGNDPKTKDKEIGHGPDRVADDGQDEQRDRRRAGQSVDGADEDRTKRLVKSRAAKPAIQLRRRNSVLGVTMGGVFVSMWVAVDVVAMPMRMLVDRVVDRFRR